MPLSLPSSTSTATNKFLRDQGAIMMEPFRVEGTAAELCFPEDLGHNDNQWPFMKLFPYSKDGKAPARSKTIFLPIPPSLTFSDGAAFSNIDLGIVGSSVAEIVGAMNSAQAGGSGIIDRTMSGLRAGVTKSISEITRKVPQLNVAAAASIAAKQLGGTNISNLINYGAKQVVNPNVASTFQNTEIRSYNFAIKMIARSRFEGRQVKAICDTLRLNLYPEGNEVVLSYPPIWKIEFFNGSGEENRNIPKIFDCHLTNLSTTFNGSTNAWHDDGKPFEVDLSMTFREVRALHRGDMEKLLHQERDVGPSFF